MNGPTSKNAQTVKVMRNGAPLGYTLIYAVSLGAFLALQADAFNLFWLAALIFFGLIIFSGKSGQAAWFSPAHDVKRTHGGKTLAGNAIFAAVLILNIYAVPEENPVAALTGASLGAIVLVPTWRYLMPWVYREPISLFEDNN